jgi:hypothetical protein
MLRRVHVCIYVCMCMKDAVELNVAGGFREYVNVCMYLCIYVRMYACICMYVCV